MLAFSGPQFQRRHGQRLRQPCPHNTTFVGLSIMIGLRGEFLFPLRMRAYSFRPRQLGTL